MSTKVIRFETWHVLFKVYAPVSDMYITVLDVLGDYCVLLLNGTIAKTSRWKFNVAVA
jgi:hypothetical protein